MADSGAADWDGCNPPTTANRRMGQRAAGQPGACLWAGKARQPAAHRHAPHSRPARCCPRRRRRRRCSPLGPATAPPSACRPSTRSRRGPRRACRSLGRRRPAAHTSVRSREFCPWHYDRQAPVPAHAVASTLLQRREVLRPGERQGRRREQAATQHPLSRRTADSGSGPMRRRAADADGAAAVAVRHPRRALPRSAAVRFARRHVSRGAAGGPRWRD